jgi:threonine/homoserine/homoserine lactone efflux protein
MLIEKFVLGMTLAMPIGPVSVEMIRRGLKNGFWAAFNIRLGGALGNSLCLVLAYFGLSIIVKHPLIFNIIGFLGALLLLYMGFNILSKFSKAIPLTPVSQYLINNSILLGFILAVVNPIGLIFWLSVFAAGIEPAQGTTIQGLFENSLIIVGILFWGALLSLFLELSRKLINHKWIQLINLLAGIGLLGYGAKYLYTNMITLLSP